MIQKRYRLVDPHDNSTHFTSGWHDDNENGDAAFVETYAQEFRERNGSGYVMEIDTQEITHISTERFVSIRQGEDL